MTASRDLRRAALSIIFLLGLIAAGILAFLRNGSTEGDRRVLANPELRITKWVVGSPPMQNVLSLETATTPEERRRGLMARDAIGAVDGMVFAMDGRPTAFWMRGTRIPLDIAYVSPEGRVSRVVRGRPFDETLLPSGGPASLVIEVAAGRAGLLGLRPGASVRRDAGGPSGGPGLQVEPDPGIRDGRNASGEAG